MKRVRSRFRVLAVSLLLSLSSCAQLVQYTDEIVDSRTGRSLFVTAPATAGGFLGFLIGIPVDVVALPVTFTFYLVQKDQDELRADPLSTMLFPSFVLWRAGTLIGTPFDAVHYLWARAGRPPRSLTGEELAEIEYSYDLKTLPDYPVKAIYPRPESAERDGR